MVVLQEASLDVVEEISINPNESAADSVQNLCGSTIQL